MMANTLDGKKKSGGKREIDFVLLRNTYMGNKWDRARRKKDGDLWKETIRFKRRSDEIYG